MLFLVAVTDIYSYCLEYRKMPRGDDAYTPPVDVFITVAGEPVDIVEETLQAALRMDYPEFYVYILNDSYARKTDNWMDIIELAKQYGAGCITRENNKGAKAGNINNGMRHTDSPFVAIFDADHVPHSDFLRKTMRYFIHPKMAFVQTPQFYKNNSTNYITSGAWDQQSLFFGAILRGKNNYGAATMCGTNMVIRREPLEAVGGMCDTNIAEDFVTGLFIQQRGYTSLYVPEVLAEGLAPEDFLSYYKQQLRWARGSLEVLFKYNPIFKRGLTWGQKIQYLASASYYLSGLFVLINISIPIVFFFFGYVPFLVSTMVLAIVFLPYIFLTLYLVQLSSNFTYTFTALAFSMSSWTIHLRALGELLIGRKTGFSITSKKALSGNFIRLSAPHIAYWLIAFSGITWALVREGISASVVTNTAWALLNCAIFFPFIKASSRAGAAKLASSPEMQSPLTAPSYAFRSETIQ
jgi:cellulose synthase (UDP-forming)